MTQVNPMITAQPTPAAPRRWSAVWAVAATLIVGILVAGGIVAYWSHAVVSAPGRVTDAVAHFAADAVRPKVMVNEVVLTSLKDLKSQNKLVVLDTQVSTDVTREEGSSSWGVYWGTNIARVAVKDAHVQYCVDLSGLQTSDFDYSAGSRTLCVTVPKPRLDAEMVAIDPANIETLDMRGGWARWDKVDTRDRAIAELKPKVMAQADKNFVQHLAEESATDALTRLVEPLAQRLTDEPVTVRIAYR